MRLMAVLLAVASSCGQETKAENTRLSRELAEATSEVTRLKAMLREREQDLALADIAAKACSEPEMVRQMRIHIEQNIHGFSANMGFRVEDVFDERGHLRNPGKFAARLREWAIKNRGKSLALPVLIDTFGAEVGSAIYYGRIGANAAGGE